MITCKIAFARGFKTIHWATYQPSSEEQVFKNAAYCQQDVWPLGLICWGSNQGAPFLWLIWLVLSEVLMFSGCFQHLSRVYTSGVGSLRRGREQREAIRQVLGARPGGVLARLRGAGPHPERQEHWTARLLVPALLLVGRVT